MPGPLERPRILRAAAMHPATSPTHTHANTGNAFQRKMRALAYPPALSTPPAPLHVSLSAASYRLLVAWLESTKIRLLKVEERASLRDVYSGTAAPGSAADSASASSAAAAPMAASAAGGATCAINDAWCGAFEAYLRRLDCPLPLGPPGALARGEVDPSASSAVSYPTLSSLLHGVCDWLLTQAVAAEYSDRSAELNAVSRKW